LSIAILVRFPGFLAGKATASDRSARRRLGSELQEAASAKDVDQCLLPLGIGLITGKNRFL
jgi:hypothetical protein